jgi:hypothetical protein
MYASQATPSRSAKAMDSVRALPRGKSDGNDIAKRLLYVASEHFLR